MTDFFKKQVNHIKDRATSGESKSLGASAKIMLASGALCLIVAVVFIALRFNAQEHQFESPMWVTSAVVAGLFACSALFQTFSRNACEGQMRNKTLFSVIVFVLLTILLKSKQYDDFKVTLSPELISFIASYAFWILYQFEVEVATVKA